ncbi:TonB-dependent receptor [Marinilongibacter aquaticus]|uniref:TonB-dependent receptor n=1 Tax=Marinilongibacter aquaticus TaxID=2975157 RepID=UPI0021BDD260|nr:TonB-dependent receptor [Marinilongibacter aquaticus]UBM57452.1 TonB-dependent receptor [Marinilongibacter aquaticus]
MNKFLNIKFLFFLGLLLGFRGNSFAQDSLSTVDLTEVVVSATRASEKTGMAYSTIREKQIKKQNLGQDIPFLLNQMPSVVVTSDAGAGVGYTGIRIRGTDATRINVTLNGIPYNDSESQGVFWVNMPDFASSISSIQVQRGVGTSTNGAGAFGASINVNTLKYSQEPYAEINSSVGSFNTLKTNVLASTGLMNDHFVLDARLSRIVSDGYVDRASSDLKSFYVSGGYYAKENFVRLNVFSGKEKTYQSWYGVPESLAKGDRAGFDDFIARNYYSDDFANELWKAGRQYNWYQYENETDNYQQDHYQLISSFKIAQNWRFNPTLHYTYGRGYYEQYKNDRDFAEYGLTPITIGDTEINTTDLIQRKWLDNRFYGGVWSLVYEGKSKLTGSFGGGWNKYDGDHFGEIIWARYASDSEIRQHWYDNKGIKTDFNVYAKGFYQFNEKLNAYADMQYRSVGISVNGITDPYADVHTDNTYNFFNPKLGLNYAIDRQSSAYLSYAVGNKEPSRQDIVNYYSYTVSNGEIQRQPKVKPENLQDFELGYRFLSKGTQVQANAYFMKYKDQLVLTGAINNVGESIRLNVPDSYRAGIELQLAQQLSEKFLFNGNVTLSRNKIKEFNEFVPSYDGETPDEYNRYTDTDISFSPSVIAGASLSYKPCKVMELAILPKYVGKQYLDNTSSEDRTIDPYFVSDFRINFELNPTWAKALGVSLLVNNVFNAQYSSNGYTYSYLYGEKITENFLYPQAGTNFLAAIRLRF